MITVESIIDRIDDVLGTGRSDARYHVMNTLQYRDHGTTITEVDDLEAHEIYESTLARYEGVSALLVHGYHQVGGYEIILTDLTGLDLRLSRKR